MVVVALTDLSSITLTLVRLDLSDGNEHLSFDMSPRLPDVKYTLLQLLSSEPQRLFVEMPDLGASIQAFLVSEQQAMCTKFLKAGNR